MSLPIRVITVLGILMFASVAMPRTARAADLVACVQNTTGYVRIVNAASDCKVYETVVLLSAARAPSPSGSVNEHSSHFFTTCTDPGVVVLSLPVVLSDPSIVLAFGRTTPQRTVAAPEVALFHTRAELLSDGTIVASRPGTSAAIGAGQFVGDDASVSGPLLDADGIYEAAPGTYTLQLSMDLGSGFCGQSIATPATGVLSFVTQPAK